MLLELAHCRRAVARKSICHVAVDLRHLLREILDRFRPQVDLVRAIDLHARVIDEVAIRTHPPDVTEVSGGTGCEIQHQPPRDPAAVGHGQGDIVLLEQCHHPVRYPAAMPEFDRDPEISGNASEEVDECRERTGLKVRTHLDQYRAELVAELAHSREENL